MAGIPALKDSFLQLKTRMDKAVQDFQTNLASTRTGRASIQMLDQVRVDYYGTPTPLNQVGQLTTPDANMIVIQPWDTGIIVEIEKALRTSDLGFNPQNAGNVV
jgi:ribosome recycling factor